MRNTDAGSTCFCRIELERGYIELEAKVLNVSSHGLRILFSYNPEISDVIYVKPTLFSNYLPSAVPVIVRWVKAVDKAARIYDVGCEVRDADLNLSRHLENICKN